MQGRERRRRFRGILRNGVTSYLPTTLTASTEQLESACASVAEYVEAGDDRPHARIQGIFLEGPFFTEKYKGAQNPAYLSAPTMEKLNAWQEAAHGLVKKIAVAPEYEGAAEFTADAVASGVVVALGHSAATCEQAQACLDAGAKVFVHTYNGMSGLHHREPGMVGAALSSQDKSFSELICDGHHVNPISAGIVMRAKGHGHVALITDCMCAGGMPDGDYFLGELPVVVAGGTARLKDGGSLAGSILNMKDAVKNVADWGIATKAEAIYMATQAPAEANDIDDVCGSIRPGRDADFVVLGKDLTLAETLRHKLPGRANLGRRLGTIREFIDKPWGERYRRKSGGYLGAASIRHAPVAKKGRAELWSTFSRTISLPLRLPAPAVPSPPLRQMAASISGRAILPFGAGRRLFAFPSAAAFAITMR